MRKFTWQARGRFNGREYKLERTHQKEICGESGEEVRPDGFRQVGLVVVYVDDLMVLAEPHAKHSFMKRLKEEWACSTPEEVGHEAWVRFVVRAAMERSRGSQEVEGGTTVLHPRSVESHQVEHPRPVPQTKADSGLPEEEQPAIESIRQAQTVVGELLWLSIRTRPAVSFASQLGRQVNKRPKPVVKTAQQAFGYMKGT